MGSAALQHLVEHVHALHAAELDAVFPGSFDWQRLCLDTPSMVARATDGAVDVADAGLAHAIHERADAVFRFAHLAALCVLAAAEEGGADPASLVEPLLAAPDDEEEERFAESVAENLDAIERRCADEEVALGESGEEALARLGAAWPLVEEFLAESELLEGDEGLPGEAADLARPVLGALARVAAILAVLRWMSAYPGADGPER
jgi:hypothetical protein